MERFAHPTSRIFRLRRWTFKTSGYTKKGKPLKRFDSILKPLQGFPIFNSALGSKPKAAANLCIIIAALLMIILALPARAQDAVATPAVTADEVNAVARQMYCPVCENIPLDVCPTAACAQWRDEIQAQLAAGESEDQIIAAFVARYGDRVVGTPQDPTLRALSLVTPWLITLVVVGAAGLLLRRWWRGRAPSATFAPASSGDVSRSDEDYRARLERDLQARR